MSEAQPERIDSNSLDATEAALRQIEEVALNNPEAEVFFNADMSLTIRATSPEMALTIAKWNLHDDGAKRVLQQFADSHVHNQVVAHISSIRGYQLHQPFDPESDAEPNLTDARDLPPPDEPPRLLPPRDRSGGFF